MTITPEDLNQLRNTDAALGQPGSPEQEADAKAATNSPASIAASQVLATPPSRIPTANSRPNVPSPNQGPEEEAPDFSSKFHTTFQDLLAYKGINGIPPAPGDTIKAMIFAGNKAMGDGAPGLPGMSVPAEGSTSWDQAQRNTDQTKPVNMPQQPNPQVVAAQNALQSFAAGAGAEGSPFNAISKNIEAQQQQRKDALTNAATWAHTLHEQVLLHQLGEQQVAEAAKAGVAGRDMILNAHHPGTLLADGKSSDEIQRMVQNRDIDLKTDVPFLTGRKQIGTDENGIPQFRSTYSVVRLGGPITFDEGLEKERNYINEKLGYKESDPQYVKPGQQLPAVQVNNLYKQAQTADANEAANEDAINKAEIKRKEVELPDDARRLKNSMAYANVLGQVKSSPDDPFAPAKAFYVIRNTPDILKEIDLGKNELEDAFRYMISGGDQKQWDTYLQKFNEERQKAQDKLIQSQTGSTQDLAAHPDLVATQMKQRQEQLAQQKSQNDATLASKTASQADKDAAALSNADIDKQKKQVDARLQLAQQYIVNKRADEVQTEKDKLQVKNQGVQFDPIDDSELVGEDYLNALPASKRSVLQAIYEGREVRSPRQLQDKNGNFSPVAIALHRAYPDYNLQKAIGYSEAVKQFESDKPHTPGYQLNAGATALKHLEDLDRIASAHPLQVRNPLSNAGQQYDTLLEKLAAEMLDFYGESKTNETIAAQKKTLGATFASRGAAIQESAQAMGEKFVSLEQSWNEASPTPSFRPPMPRIDDEAKAAARHLVPQFAKDHPQIFGDSAVASTQTAREATPNQKAAAAVSLPKSNDPKKVWAQAPGHPPMLVPNTPENIAKIKAAVEGVIIGPQ